MKRSAIEWCDYSGGNLNFVRRGRAGDCEVSYGCRACYARRIGERFDALPDVTTVYPEKLERLRTQAFPMVDGRRPRCFVCDTGDLFHDNVPRDVLDEAFRVFMFRPDVVWQILTKRASRLREFVRWWAGQAHGDPYVPEHIWIGVSAEDQACADERLPLLLDTPAAIRFVSCEPLQSRVDLSPWLAGLALVIAGGETGAKACPTEPAWVRSLRDQCVEGHVPFLFKGWGEWCPLSEAMGRLSRDQVQGAVPSAAGSWHLRTGKARSGRLLDGRVWNQFPEVG